MTVHPDILPFILDSQELSPSKLYIWLSLPFFLFPSSSPQHSTENTLLENTENPLPCVWGPPSLLGAGAALEVLDTSDPYTSHESSGATSPALSSEVRGRNVSVREAQAAISSANVWCHKGSPH